MRRRQETLKEKSLRISYRKEIFYGKGYVNKQSKGANCRRDKKKSPYKQIFVAFPIKMGLYLQLNHKTGPAKTENSG